MKHLCTLLALIGTAMLQEQQPDFTTVLDFARLDTTVDVHQAVPRRQQAHVIQDDKGQPQFRLEWVPSMAPHLEFCFTEAFTARHTRLTPFTIAEFEIKAFIPDNHSVNAINLRLRDHQGEILQYRAPVTPAMNGWQTFRFTVDGTKENTSSWGGNDSANKKLDFPVHFHGIAVNFTRENADGMSNWILLGEVKMAVMLDLTPATLQLDACNDVRVMTPGHEGEAILNVINTTKRVVSATLNYAVADERGNALETGKRHLRLLPQETIGTPLPKPRHFGVTIVNAQLTDDDSRVSTVSISARYAYMVPAGPTSGRGKGFLFGVCSHPQRYSLADQAKEALAAGLIGIKILREDINWGHMQPSPTTWTFESFDKTVEIFGNQGIELEAIYSYCAPWAHAKTWERVVPQSQGGALPDSDYWSQFISTFAKRYRNKVWYVEVWNEPDLSGFANFPAEDYINLMKIAFTETKKQAPEMTVLTGGFALMPPSSHRSFFDPDHMRKTLTLGRGFYDVHAFHGHGRFNDYREKLTRMFAMRKAEAITAPWYANETALPDVDGGELYQAITLFQKFLYSWARGSIGYNWYDLRNDGFDPKYGEHHFGLITFDFYPKAAYVTYNTLATLFTEAIYLQDVPFGESLDAFAFRAKNGDLLIPCWSVDPQQSDTIIALSGITGQADIIDIFGNSTPVNVQNQALVLKVSHEPCTLRLKHQPAIPVPHGQFFAMLPALNTLKGSGNSKDYAARKQDFSIVPGQQTPLAFSLTNPTDTPLDATIAITLPKGLTAQAASQTATLLPHSSQTLSFMLNAAPDYGLEDTESITVKASLGKLWNNVIALDATPVAIIPPRQNMPQFILNKRSQYTKLVAEMAELQHLSWNGPEDLSARIWLDTRNNDTLLLKAVVVDDTHFQPFKGFDIWQGDSIQFALNLGTEPTYEFGLAHCNDGSSEFYVFSAPQGHTPKLSLTTSRDEATHQTVYEAAIPFAEIGMTPQTLKDGFLFNVIVNDNDGEGREGYLALAPGIGATKSARHFHIVQSLR